MRGVEMNARDPSPAGHVQIDLNLGHRSARGLAQSIFAFFVARAEALEVLFAKADREVDEVTLLRGAAPAAQVLDGLGVCPVVPGHVILAVREQGASLSFTKWIELALGEVARYARSALATHRFDLDHSAHNYPRYLLAWLICGCSVIPKSAISRYCGNGGSALASSGESGAPFQRRRLSG